MAAKQEIALTAHSPYTLLYMQTLWCGMHESLPYTQLDAGP
jgi:hypothetical protein